METNMEDPTDDAPESQTLINETPTTDVFLAPSITKPLILSGESYTYQSPIPSQIQKDLSIPCVLGVDEAGRGPVLGPMVYGLLYLPLTLHHSLLAETHHFDDSKVLTPAVRSNLMEKICTPATDLYENCGWSTRMMSARDISAAQLRPNGAYNLNAQAMDATADLIRGVLDAGVNVTEVYIDTIGPPETYQKRLERIFPSLRITVAKKADSLYPCVSAASVCAAPVRPSSKATAASWANGSSTSSASWAMSIPIGSTTVTAGGTCRSQSSPSSGTPMPARARSSTH